MACCGSPGPCEDGVYSADEDEFSLGTPDDTMTDVSGASTDLSSVNEVLNVDYSISTPLFSAIERKDWESVLLFLKSGKWSNSLFVSSAEHMKGPSPEIQSKTWVSEYTTHKKNKTIVWSQLPIHAAVAYGAPAIVLQKLLELYPDSIKSRDSENMLPIHLAFGFGAIDGVIMQLLNSWPESIKELGGPARNRLPHHCCELGPNRSRGEILSLFINQMKGFNEAKCEKEWKKVVSKESKRLKLETPEMESVTLPALLKQLLEERKQLLKMKEELKGTFGLKRCGRSADRSVAISVKTASSKRSFLLPHSPTKQKGGGVGWTKRFASSTTGSPSNKAVESELSSKAAELEL